MNALEKNLWKDGLIACEEVAPAEDLAGTVLEYGNKTAKYSEYKIESTATLDEVNKK